MMNFVLKMMDFILKMIDFVLWCLSMVCADRYMGGWVIY